MKQKILLMMVAVGFFTVTLQAQTTVWDFGKSVANGGTYAVTTGYGTNVVIDNLGYIPHGTSANFGQIEASGGATWDAGTAEEYVATQRFKTNGSGAAIGTYMPTVRSLYLSVTGPVLVKIWYRIGGTSTPRSLYVTDGTNLLGEHVSTGTDTPGILTANYTGGVGTLYIYGAGNAYNLYKIEVTPTTNIGTTTTLGVKQYEKTTAVNVYASSKNVFVKNVQANTTVEVYNMTGSLVKKVATSTDTDFELKPGAYLVKIQAEDGQKVVKLLTQ